MLTRNDRKKLRKEILRKHPSLTKFCEEAQISIATMSQYLTGKSKNLKPENALKISKKIDLFQWQQLSGLEDHFPRESK